MFLSDMSDVFVLQGGSNGCDTNTRERSGCNSPPAPLLDGPHVPLGRGESGFPDLCLPWGTPRDRQCDGWCCSGSCCETFKKHAMEPRGGRWESWRAAEGGEDPA